jgi:hypothetical protein
MVIKTVLVVGLSLSLSAVGTHARIVRVDALTPTPVAICLENEDCGSNEYCVKRLGDCDGPGRCIDRLPDMVQCLAVWDPVCGCDGVTYANACYAAQAAVSIDYPGACVGGCLDNDDCPPDEYCVKPLGDCDGAGRCIDRLPDLVQCLTIWDPVCGCDGVTYANACYAAQAAVSIDHLGECVEGCRDNADCSVDTYCNKDTGDCDGVGACAAYPMLCQNIWIPVCGCNGQTYSNGCYAHRAGINVAYEGECGN